MHEPILAAARIAAMTSQVMANMSAGADDGFTFNTVIKETAMFTNRLSPSAWLRTVLWADAACCVAMGALLAAGADALAGPFGLPAALLRAAGIGLLPFAALVAWIARRGAARAGVWLVVAANALWVVDSVALLALGGFAPSALGQAFVLGQAGAVAALAILEAQAQRRRDAAAAR